MTTLCSGCGDTENATWCPRSGVVSRDGVVLCTIATFVGELIISPEVFLAILGGSISKGILNVGVAIPASVPPNPTGLGGDEPPGRPPIFCSKLAIAIGSPNVISPVTVSR